MLSFSDCCYNDLNDFFAISTCASIWAASVKYYILGKGPLHNYLMPKMVVFDPPTLSRLVTSP